MVVNGRVPATQMTELLDGQRLLNPAAQAVNTAVHVGALIGVTVHPPRGGDRGISGYRDLTLQALFVAAAHGDRAAAVRCDMDPGMRVSMGAVGYQSHGWADRIDLLFDGNSPSQFDLDLMARYGAIREFGTADRNHFWVKSPKSAVDVSDKNRIVAHFLNGQKLGKTTTTDVDGVWPAKSNLSWMIQEYSSKQNGWYPQPQYKIDGDAGTRTTWCRDHLFDVLWTS